MQAIDAGAEVDKELKSHKMVIATVVSVGRTLLNVRASRGWFCTVDSDGVLVRMRVCMLSGYMLGAMPNRPRAEVR
jgi:hypothetical protein